MSHPTPTFIVLGIGGHRVVVGTGGIPYVKTVASQDGKNPNKPLPNWMVRHGDDMPVDLPLGLLCAVTGVPVTGHDGERYMAYYEFPLAHRGNDTFRLSLDMVDLARLKKNYLQLYGMDHPPVLSECGIRDQNTQPMKSENVFFATEYSGAIELDLNIAV